MAKRTIALDPDHYLGYLDLGYLHESHRYFTGDPEDPMLSRKYVQQAYRLNPELQETNAAMAFMLFRTGKVDSAFSYTKKALALHANSWEPWHLLGTNMASLGLYRQAIQFYDKAAELNPFNMYTFTNRGWNLLYVGEVDRALEDFVRSYGIQPDCVPNLIGYATAVIFKKQYQQADSLLQHAEKQPPTPSDPDLKSTRALYFAVLGEREKALALSWWPGVLVMLGMEDEAIVAIDQKTKSQGVVYDMLSYLSLKRLPIYDNLRDDPRFQEILERQKAGYEERLKKYSLIGTN